MWFKKKCYFCKKKIKDFYTYQEKGKKLYCCSLCKSYAERRAFVAVR